MAMISKTKRVPYTPDEMYLLVNDIESYPAFLPWCKEARIIRRGDNRLIASLSLGLGKIKQCLKTENTFRTGAEITIRLVDGPFKHLNGSWQFSPYGQACDVCLQMDFEFKNALVKHTLGKVLYQAMNSLVEAFVKRAEEIYGKRQR